jgi:hypothetical protein
MISPLLPKGVGAGEFVQTQFAFKNAISSDLVVKQKAIAVAAEYKRNLQHVSVA